KRELLQLTKLASEGSRERRIALTLKMSVPTWIKCKRDFPEVADALALGQEMLFERIVGNLLRQSDRGNVIAGIFLSKALCGLRENDEPTELRPTVTIHLPASLAPEQWAARRRALTLEAEAPALAKQAHRG